MKLDVPCLEWIDFSAWACTSGVSYACRLMARHVSWKVLLGGGDSAKGEGRGKGGGDIANRGCAGDLASELNGEKD